MQLLQFPCALGDNLFKGKGNLLSPINTPKVNKTLFEMFPFKRLPAEIRLMIYNLNGVLQFSIDGRKPALLRALRRDPTLYQEAKVEFYRTNVMFTLWSKDPKRPIEIEPKHVRHVLINAKEWPTSRLHERAD